MISAGDRRPDRYASFRSASFRDIGGYRSRTLPLRLGTAFGIPADTWLRSMGCGAPHLLKPYNATAPAPHHPCSLPSDGSKVIATPFMQ